MVVRRQTGERGVRRGSGVEPHRRDPRRRAGRIHTLRERYERIEARQSDPTPAQLAQAWSDVATILVDATRARVEALNRHEFSPEEYRWVRARVLEAAGYAAPAYDLPQLASGGADPATTEAEFSQRAVPPANVELVEPHRDVIEETLPFAYGRPSFVAGRRQGCRRTPSRGKARAKRTLGIPSSSAVRRSAPIAKPPWGGMPCRNTSR